MAEIETVYRARIDFDWDRVSPEFFDNDVQEAIEKRAFQFARNEKYLELEIYDGCSACGPYIELESNSRAQVARVAGKIERYINRRKGVELKD